MRKQQKSMAQRQTERTYRSEYYKKNSNWGVKQKVASKRQVFSVGGMGLGKTKQGLKKIVDKAIQKMEKGASEEETKTWAQNEARFALGCGTV